jgi:hypothetical protein
MARIRIEDLPPVENLTPEELEEILGAGLRSFRPTFEALDARELMDAGLGRAVLPSLVGPPNTGAPAVAHVREFNPAADMKVMYAALAQSALPQHQAAPQSTLGAPQGQQLEARPQMLGAPQAGISKLVTDNALADLARQVANHFKDGLVGQFGIKEVTGHNFSEETSWDVAVTINFKAGLFKAEGSVTLLFKTEVPRDGLVKLQFDQVRLHDFKVADLLFDVGGAYHKITEKFRDFKTSVNVQKVLGEAVYSRASEYLKTMGYERSQFFSTVTRYEATPTSLPETFNTVTVEFKMFKAGKSHTFKLFLRLTNDGFRCSAVCQDGILTADAVALQKLMASQKF